MSPSFGRRVKRRAEPVAPAPPIAEQPDPLVAQAAALNAQLQEARELHERTVRARLEYVAEAHNRGWSHARIATALGVSKPRAQQLAGDAHRAGLCTRPGCTP